MSQAVVPFAGVQELPRMQTPALPGMAQGVYILLHPDVVDEVSTKIAGWTRDFDDVQIVDVGISDKQGLGFIIVEWIEREVDRFFLAVLRDEETVGDYTLYGRTLEG